MKNYQKLFRVPGLIVRVSLVTLLIVGQISTISLADPLPLATLTASLLVDQNSNSLVDPGDTLRYRAELKNKSATDMLDITFTNVLDLQTTLVNGSLNVSPLAVNDSYTAVGNTWLVVGGTPSSDLVVNVSGSVLDNDLDFLGDTFSITAFDAASAKGGTIQLNQADGSFRYLPAVGFTGTDTFTYTVTDSKGLTDIGTVTVSVGARVWYVDGAASPGGDGRSNAPFQSMQQAQTSSQVNDVIYVFHHSNSYAGGIVLKNNQRLVGEGVALVVEGYTLNPAGTSPTLANINGAVVNLASGSQVEGVNIDAQAGEGLYGSNLNAAISVQSVTINASAAGGGVRLVDLSAPFTFTNGQINGQGGLPAVRINGGDRAINFSSVPVSQTGNARGVDISNRTGGTVAFGPGSLVAKTAGSGEGIYLSSNSGTVIFSGASQSITTGADPAVTLVNAGIVQFTGGKLSISTSSGAGLNATGSGSLLITGANNTISTTTGRAVNIENVSIAPDGVTFRSVSANGAVNAINLANAGSNGFTITGEGATLGSGGLITNITQSGLSITNTGSINLANLDLTHANLTDAAGCTEDSNAACYAAIKLTSVTGVTLTRLRIDGAAQTGINGTTVSNFSLVNSTIQNIGASQHEDGIDLRELTGSNSISNSTISNSYDRNMLVRNTAGTLTALTITGSTFNGTNSVNGRQGLMVHFPSGSTGTGLVEVTDSFFTNNHSDAIQVANEGNNRVQVRVLNNSGVNKGFTNNNLGVNLITNYGGWLEFNISNNNFDNTHQGVNVGLYDIGTQISNGRINNNSISSSDDFSIAVFVVQEGNGRGVVEINGNTITQFGDSGIDVESRGGTGQVDATITNNSINHGGSPYPLSGVFLRSGNNSLDETSRLCVNLANNSVEDGGLSEGHFYLDRWSPSATKFFIQGLSPTPVTITSNYTTNAVGSFLLSNNPGASTYFVEKGVYEAAVSACLTPSFTADPQLIQRVAAVEVNREISAIEVVESFHAPATSAAFGLPVDMAVTGGKLDVNAAVPIAAVNPIQFANNPRRAPGLAKPAAAGETVSVSIAALPAGKTLVIVFDAQVNNPLPIGVSQVSTQGVFTGSNFSMIFTDDPGTAASNDPTVTNLNVTANLQLLKSDGDLLTAVPGSLVKYTLSYANHGPYGAGSVVITETVPANTTFSATDSTPGWSCADNSPAGTSCKITLGDLVKDASGSVVFAVRIKPSLPAGVIQISNTGEISSNVADPDLSNNSASDVTPVTAAPDLRLEKSDGDSTFLRGEVVVYTLKVSNAGTQDATGVVMTDTVPVNSTFYAASSSPGWSCANGDPAGTICHLPVGNLNTGASASYTFAVQTIAVGGSYEQITNTASVADDGTNGLDLNPADNTATDSTPRLNEAPTLTNLTVTPLVIKENESVTLSGNISGPEVEDALIVVINWGDGTPPETLNLPPGTTQFSRSHTYLDDNPSGTTSDSYTIQVSVTDDKGASTSGSTSVTVINQAPVINPIADLQAYVNVPVNFQGGFTDAGTQDTHTIQWNFGDGSPVVSGTLTPTHTFGSAGEYTVKLTVTDDDLGESSTTFKVTVLYVANLEIETTAPAEVLVQTNLVYTLRVTNHGPSPVTNVSVVNTLPGGVTFQSASAGCLQVSGTVTCSLAALGVGQSHEFFIQTRVKDDASGTLVNQVVVSSLATDPVPANNMDTTSSKVVSYLVPFASDFASPPGNEWSHPVLTTAPNGEVFLGEFGNSRVNLTLTPLPEHTQVMLSFDLYILGSWDGNVVNYPASIARMVNPTGASSVVGPDIWELQEGGQNILMRTTFSNWPEFGFTQAYPGGFPGGDYPAQTGAVAVNVLQHKYTTFTKDAVYRIVLVFPHTSKTLSLDFIGLGLQSLGDESWGLDNIEVRLMSDISAYPYRNFLPKVDR